MRTWEKRHEQLLEISREAFARHEIKSGSLEERRLVLRRPDSGYYWCEILFPRSAVMVHGDISTAVFGYHNENDPRMLTAWVARSGLTYMGEKFRIGMNDGGSLCWDWDADVAVRELEERRQDWMEDGVGDLEEAREKFDAAVDAARDGDRYGLRRALFDLGEYDLDPGKVLAPRVYHAKAAVERLWQLIS